MTLIQLNVRDVTVTAEKVGEHFAIHPAILHNEDTGDFTLSSDHWDIQHLPSNKSVMFVHQEDPVEYPGEPRAVDLDKVRTFLGWLEQQADWSCESPDLSVLPKETRMTIALFRADPNYHELGRTP
ncbi:hypothetical protein [Rhodococcus artemisiae]|uniref:Uncharacterized protein n=1 Tax=Rhodococcus artemisiae TaxID=714159 RepID=A0ABU7LBN0_9NOCA|nr:hypothetical protein [Rhodococcus artemisiae]MEE2058955.1 hypothetical protein [Rhodococcus artemisiae]